MQVNTITRPDFKGDIRSCEFDQYLVIRTYMQKGDNCTI